MSATKRSDRSWRSTFWVASSIAVLAPVAFTSRAGWMGGAPQHALLEIGAALLALSADALARIRFQADREPTSLFVAAGLLGCGLLDAHRRPAGGGPLRLPRGVELERFAGLPLGHDGARGALFRVTWPQGLDEVKEHD